MRFQRVLVGFLSVLISSNGNARQGGSLGSASGKLRHAFSAIRAIRELPGGKVIVIDTRERSVLLGDFDRDTATTIGRQGQGPGEYTFPVAALPMPEGRTWIWDGQNRRFIELDAAGQVGQTIATPSEIARAAMTVAPNRAADAQGNLFLQASPYGNDPGQQSNSVPLMRWRPSTGRQALDTVAWLELPKGNVQTGGGAGAQQFVLRVGGGKLFTPLDSWGVAADGWVIRVTPSPYRVIRYGPSRKVTTGPANAYTPIVVTEEERQSITESRRRNRVQFTPLGGSSPAGQSP